MCEVRGAYAACPSVAVVQAAAAAHPSAACIAWIKANYRPMPRRAVVFLPSQLKSTDARQQLKGWWCARLSSSHRPLPASAIRRRRSRNVQVIDAGVRHDAHRDPGPRRHLTRARLPPLPRRHADRRALADGARAMPSSDEAAAPTRQRSRHGGGSGGGDGTDAASGPTERAAAGDTVRVDRRRASSVAGVPAAEFPVPGAGAAAPAAATPDRRRLPAAAPAACSQSPPARRLGRRLPAPLQTARPRAAARPRTPAPFRLRQGWSRHLRRLPPSTLHR